MKPSIRFWLSTAILSGLVASSCANDAAAQAAAPAGDDPAGPAAALFQNGARQISLGAPTSHENLTVFPLLAAPPADGNPYRPFDAAIDKGAVRVREMSSAAVNTLRVGNAGDEKVFIMTGEIVTGAKQDRMSAHDVLLPPREEAVELPVYCVEQHRWVHTSGQFAAGRTAGTTVIRKTAAKKGGQSEIWSKVEEKSGEAAVHSDTGTMQAVYDDRKVQARVKRFEKALLPLGGERAAMVGFVAAVDGRIVSSDLFANHDLFAALWPKLLKALAIDAITSPAPAPAVPEAAAAVRFARAGFDGVRTRTENPGLGEEYLIAAEGGIDGTVLIFEGEIVHLAAFGPDREDRPRSFGPTERPRANQPAARPASRSGDDDVDELLGTSGGASAARSGKTRGGKKAGPRRSKESF